MGDGALWSDRHISISLFGFPLQLLCPALPLFALSVGRRWLVPLNRPPPPLFSAFLLRVFLSVGCFCMGCLHPTCPSCGRVLCAIGLCWCVSAVLLAVSRISCCFFRPRLCALLARRAAFLLCPRRGLWPYYNSPPSSGRALMRYWPVLLHSSLVLGMAFGHYSCLSLLLRAAPPCALRLVLGVALGHINLLLDLTAPLSLASPAAFLLCRRRGLWPFLPSLAAS